MADPRWGLGLGAPTCIDYPHNAPGQSMRKALYVIRAQRRSITSIRGVYRLDTHDMTSRTGSGEFGVRAQLSNYEMSQLQADVAGYASPCQCYPRGEACSTF
jgi:hypothetical protein